MPPLGNRGNSMKFTPTSIEGAFIVDITKIEDDRGFFARIFCSKTFEDQNLNGDVVQANLSFNATQGTVRGMHYQIEPALETKFVRCVSGSVADVIVDLRPESSTYLQHQIVELSSENKRALFIPAMVAHGFQTLSDNSELLYMVSGAYSPDNERGLRANDPALGISWPLPISHQSLKDENWALLPTPNNQAT